MKNIVLTGLFALALITPAASDDIPFASVPNEKPGKVIGSLGDIMSLTQMRHIKLWYAGKANNWALANYEIGQLEDTLAKAAMHYTNIPIEHVLNAVKPLAAMREAVQAKNFAAFSDGYANLTNACNSCHKAAGAGFIHIQTPVSSPFSDEVF